MTIIDIKEEIERLIVFLLINELILDLNNPIIRELAGNKAVLTWAGAPKTGVIHNQFASISEYMSIAINRDFHFMFNDGGIIQFGYIFDDDKILQQRFCFYPCPLEISQDQIDIIQPSEDFITLFKIILEEELSELNNHLLEDILHDTRTKLKTRSPFRFDFNYSKDNIDHPASHLHVNKRSCRIPVFGPISIGHFMRFIIRSFYPQMFSDYLKLKDWPLSYRSRTVREEHMRDLFIECGQ